MMKSGSNVFAFAIFLFVLMILVILYLCFNYQLTRMYVPTHLAFSNDLDRGLSKLNASMVAYQRLYEDGHKVEVSKYPFLEDASKYPSNERRYPVVVSKYPSDEV